MKKLLQSGIEVDSNEYYKILEWKDKNFKEFKEICDRNTLPHSINQMNSVEYSLIKSIILFPY